MHRKFGLTPYLHFYMILEYCFIPDNNFTWENESYTFEHNLDIEFAISQKEMSPL